MNHINSIARYYGFVNGIELADYAQQQNEITFQDYKKYKNCHDLRNHIAHGNASDISISHNTYYQVLKFENAIKKSYLIVVKI